MYVKKSIIMPLLLGASNIKSFPLWVSSYLLLVTQYGATGTLQKYMKSIHSLAAHPLAPTLLAPNSSWVILAPYCFDSVTVH